MGRSHRDDSRRDARPAAHLREGRLLVPHKFFPRRCACRMVVPYGRHNLQRRLRRDERDGKMPRETTTSDHAYDPLGADDCEGLCMPALVGSSFAGALLRAMRQADPPLTLDDLILISYPLTDEDVASLLLSRRLPEADEVAVLADVMGMTLDELLECQ